MSRLLQGLAQNHVVEGVVRIIGQPGVDIALKVIEKQGRVIPYRKASLPDDRAGLEIRLKELAPVPQRRKKADAPGKRRKPRKLP